MSVIVRFYQHLNDGSLYYPTCSKQVAPLFGGWFSNCCTAVGLLRCKSTIDQLCQYLAYGAALDAENFCQMQFLKFGSGRKFVIEDSLFDQPQNIIFGIAAIRRPSVCWRRGNDDLLLGLTSVFSITLI